MLRLVEKTDKNGRIFQVIQAFPKNFKTGDEWTEIGNCIFIGKGVSENPLYHRGNLYFVDDTTAKCIYRNVFIYAILSDKYIIVRLNEGKDKKNTAALVNVKTGTTVLKFFLSEYSRNLRDSIDFCFGKDEFKSHDYFIINIWTCKGTKWILYNESGINCIESEGYNVRGEFLSERTINGVVPIAERDSDLDESTYYKVIHFYDCEDPICNTIISGNFDTVILNQISPIIKDGKLIFPYYECENYSSLKSVCYDMLGNEI